jgi:hypothetical protein
MRLCRASHIPTRMYGMANWVKRFGQNNHRLPDGVGSTGFNKADMPHEESSTTGQPESPQTARLPPSADPRLN